MKVKTILVSQPEPKIENSPYFDLQEKQKVKVESKEKSKIEMLQKKAIFEYHICLNYCQVRITSN